MIRAVIFDMDGTVFDTEKIYYKNLADVAKDTPLSRELDEDLTYILYHNFLKKSIRGGFGRDIIGRNRHFIGFYNRSGFGHRGLNRSGSASNQATSKCDEHCDNSNYFLHAGVLLS